MELAEELGHEDPRRAETLYWALWEGGHYGFLWSLAALVETRLDAEGDPAATAKAQAIREAHALLTTARYGPGSEDSIVGRMALRTRSEAEEALAALTPAQRELVLTTAEAMIRRHPACCFD